MTSISKNEYTYKLDDLVNKYKNTYHRTIKIKSIDVDSSTFTDFGEKNNEKDAKFEVGNQVSISKYKNISSKDYASNWSEEVFVIKKVRNTASWTYVVSDLKGEEIVGTFYEKELQKKNQTEFRVEKVIKKKGNKLYVQWKDYDNSFNS